MSEPPQFQESDRCDVCKCTFNTFRRRHHCRCCGRTLCYEHSSYQMALHQFGIHSNVRVCLDCFNKASQFTRDDPQASAANNATEADAFSKLHMKDDDDLQPQLAAAGPTPEVPDCKCGMPLCICKAPDPDPTPSKVQSHDPVKPAVQLNPRPRKAANAHHGTDSVSKNMGSSSKKQSLFFNLGQATHRVVDKDDKDYEVNGEGLREAIKNRDSVTVKRLLNQGVDANYCDKQGLSLLHLAAVFNQTEIAFILMDHGARVDCRNAQGETPLDCAPTMLQYKMKKKMEEGA